MNAQFTVKVTLPLVPLALVTLTFCGPVEALAAIANVAVINVLLVTEMLLIVTPAPLKLIVAPLTNWFPDKVTVMVLPRVPLVGLIEDSVGAPEFTVKVTLPLVPPAVVTLTVCGPVVAVAEITNVAVMKVLFTTEMLLMVTPAPLKLIVAPLAKLFPLSVTGIELP